MDAVEDIKSRLNIEDVVGEYVQLKRAGRNWKGLSPFGNEKTPSFMVSPEKQIWHDFSSGKGGNMFSFVMEMEGLDFKGALEQLARKAGVDLSQYRSSRPRGERGRDKERLYEALEWAAKFYQAQLKGNRNALEYVLQKRGFAKETVLAWRLGYSPNTGAALSTFLRAKGFSDQEMQQAGLSVRGWRGGARDMFRGRLMVPLQDPTGRVIGFTARLLADDPDAPKYINTPQTPLYDKSRHVFGLHAAKDTVRKSQFVVVAEGNLDVISSHQAGVRQVVATAGTALTEQHLKALSRFTGDIRLSFDADKAGLNATERAIPLASRTGVSLSIIIIPSGKDPDELVRQDPALWQAAIAQPQYALDWLIARYQAQLDLDSGPGKRQFSDIILRVVRGLADQVEQEHYIGRVAEIIGVSREALLSKLRTQASSERRPALKKPRAPARPPDKAAQDRLKTQNHLLAVMLARPELRPLLSPITTEMFADEPARTLLVQLQAAPDGAALPDGDEFATILTVLYEELYQNLEPEELRFEALRLRAKLIEQYVKQQKQSLARQLQQADEHHTAKLLEQAKQLDALLKSVKEAR